MPNYGGPFRGCQTCRKHKQKCDQTWPFCQRCVRSKRSCSGTKAPADAIFRTDALVSKVQRGALARNVHRPTHGNSGCAGASDSREDLRKSYSNDAESESLLTLSKVSSSEAELTAARLIRFLPTVAGFGHWLELLPRNLGRAPHVDQAVTVLVELLEYHCSQNDKERCLKRASQHYGNAVKSLRPHMHGRSIEDVTLISVALLATAEQLARAWHDSYESQIRDAFVHWRGIGASFLALDPGSRRSEIALALWNSCWEPVVVVPVAQRVSCPFETEDWLSLPPYGSVDDREWLMHHAINQLKIRLPGLVLHVQRLWDGTADSDAVARALAVVHPLLALIAVEPDSQIISRAEAGVPKDSLLQRLAIDEFSFASHADLETFTLYWKAVAWVNALCINIANNHSLARHQLNVDQLSLTADVSVCKLLGAWQQAQSVGPFAMVRLVQGLIIGREAMSPRKVWRGVPMEEFDEWLHPRCKLELNISAAYDQEDLKKIVQLKMGRPGVECVVTRVARSLS